MVVLPAPVGPTRAIVCPALASRRHVLDDRRACLVAEVHAVEGDLPADVLQRQRLRRHPGVRLGVSMISKTRSAPASAAWIELYIFASWCSGWMKLRA